MGLTVPFIQFADDSLFLMKADEEGIKNLKCILLIMEVATSLKVNWSKSALSPVRDVSGIEVMADILGCDVIPLPTSYLGFPLGAKASSYSIWNPIVKKLGCKLTQWKGNYLSFGGKLILLKSVLAGMPIYSLSSKRLRNLCAQVRKIAKRFFYGALVAGKGRFIG